MSGSRVVTKYSTINWNKNRFIHSIDSKQGPVISLSGMETGNPGIELQGRSRTGRVNKEQTGREIMCWKDSHKAEHNLAMS